MRDRINVHPLLIFFSILGGIKFFGINGLLLGPMIVILFFTVLDLLTEDSKQEEAVAVATAGDAEVANAEGVPADAAEAGVEVANAEEVVPSETSTKAKNTPNA